VAGRCRKPAVVGFAARIPEVPARATPAGRPAQDAADTFPRRSREQVSG